jgi:HEPN domain-containing protein
MLNRDLASDYITRAHKRLAALRALMQEEAWADVVRESQEVIELSLKALLRVANVEVPRVHDVSDALLKHADRMPEKAKPHLAEFARISRALRRDRELAFYGSEDLTPSDFYKREDAQLAFDQAQYIVKEVRAVVPPL